MKQVQVLIKNDVDFLVAEVRVRGLMLVTLVFNRNAPLMQVDKKARAHSKARKSIRFSLLARENNIYQGVPKL